MSKTLLSLKFSRFCAELKFKFQIFVLLSFVTYQPVQSSVHKSFAILRIYVQEATEAIKEAVGYS
jgi:hypothetical protein